MRRTLEPGLPRPLWVRVTALWCAFLCFGLGLAQACHSHERPSGPKHLVFSRAVDDGTSLESICPLCTGLHYLSPPNPATLPDALESRQVERPVQAVAGIPGLFPYSLNSRPPPVCLPPL